MDNETWRMLSRPTDHCSKCGQPLGDKAGHHPTIILTAGDVEGETAPDGVTGPRRIDFCMSCWETERANHGTGEGMVGFWMTRREPVVQKPVKRKPTRAALLAWFESLRQAANPTDATERHAAACRVHVAALLLLRRGALRWVGTERDSDDVGATERLMLRQTGTQRTLVIEAALPDDEDGLDLLAVEIEADLDRWLDTTPAGPEADVVDVGKVAGVDVESLPAAPAAG